MYNILTCGLSCVAFKYNCSDICRSFICLEDKKQKTKTIISSRWHTCVHRQAKENLERTLSLEQTKTTLHLSLRLPEWNRILHVNVDLHVYQSQPLTTAFLPEGVSGVKNNVELVRLFPEGLSVQLCCFCVPTSRRVQLSYKK